ncbi:MAG TPA: tetratricopeptide repeat protein, partial [Kofleriaceae bacterium]|nr:tetratricopeptide repeat protein [Kofleriaceae bacterium]
GATAAAGGHAMIGARVLAATLAAVSLLAVRPSAAGDLWTSAAVSPEQARTQHAYDQAMLDGDDAVERAVAMDVPLTRARLVERAVTSYETAAHLRPDLAEPHFRAADVLHSFYLDCQPSDPLPCPSPHTPATRQRMIEHWEAFERLAPGDPRIAEDILFSRAVARTWLGTHDDLAAARADYLELLELQPDSVSYQVLGNLAETEMMLGDIDGAIETYRRCLANGADLSEEYGLAVTLDRDEQGTEARAIMAARGPLGLTRFKDDLRLGRIFYVPAGEEYYYLALAEEALGDYGQAIDHWDAFIKSGAHPQFADRARHNRDALLKLAPPDDRERTRHVPARGLPRWPPP